jgi:hypothetical protein
MTRLGSKLPFGQAAEEVWLNQGVKVSEATVRRVTEGHGQAAEAIARAEVEELERKIEPAEATPEKIMMSADGAYIALTTGEWREVKTVAIGEFEQAWNSKKGEMVVTTKNLSYFSRSYRVREFERYGLAELHQRGVFNAQLVVAPHDGSTWLQSFTDYHVPQAKRILDFSHAAGYVADAGKAVWGEGTASFDQWFQRTRRQLKQKPPKHTLNELYLLLPKAESDEASATIDQSIHYLEKRLQQIDYPYFRARGMPIGSGSVESAHKVVVHSRLKQAGMRWADAHVDPMLALRNLVCNGRWQAGWSQIVAYHWQQQHNLFREQSKKQRPFGPTPAPNPVPMAAALPAKRLPKSSTPSPTLDVEKQQPHRPAPDHPWRQGIWPTKEAWRWI